ncbi:MAG TPA: tetratricopeptide repeat protein, partial [Tepidisphaeraceae bacterium]|nr:tetratricopeptide repeat protein [Tepidisphaeraceae bacterium]
MDMAGRKDIVGLSADIAARLMSLAVGGQILLTDAAFNNARQYVNRTPEILGSGTALKWMAHGRYLFKGADDPLEVYEVGVENWFPLSQPADSEKVKRVVPHDQESTLGWRPAVGLPVPNRPGWQLTRKLGEGGFGEVWLAEHEKLKENRVFKFCFDADRLRGLKREYVLFRLLRETLGRRTDIAALYEVKLDEPPFYLESEYSAGGSLMEWAERNGGITALSLAARLELLAKVADALAAAHSVGVLHKDIKPSNILIHQAADGQLYPRLADFGIGVLSDSSRLSGHHFTDIGVTDAKDMTSSKSLGTRMYSPPETMRDAPFTMRGDIYALGVMLYQFVVGDLLRPLAAGWERDIDDEIMRRDIAVIVEGNPDRRIAAASEVAQLLRTQDERRDKLRAEHDAAAARQRRRRRRRILAGTALGLIGLLILSLIGGGIYVRNLRIQRNRTIASTKTLMDVIRAADPANSANGSPTAESLILDASKQLDAQFSDDSDFSAYVQMSFAQALANFGDSEAVDHYQRAMSIYSNLHGPNDPKTLSAESGLGVAYLRLNDYQRALETLKDALDKQTAALGPNNRDTLQTALYYAAAVYQLQGPAAAEPLFRKTLEERENEFGVDDKDTIQSMSVDAMIEREMGHPGIAKMLAAESLEWRQKHLGPTAYGTLPSLLSYGSILVDLGHAKLGAPYIKTVLDRREQLLGADKPDTLRAMSAYADALAAMGDYAQAEPLYVKAMKGLQARDKASGKTQRDTETAVCGYAELLTATGRAAEAKPLAKEAMDYFSADAGAGARLKLRAEFAYANALAKLGDSQARNYFKDVARQAAADFGDESAFTRRYEAAAQGAATRQ